jgi:hypothetical protein
VCLLNHVHEDADDAFNVDKRATLVVHELGRKLGSLLRVSTHGMLEQSRIIRLEVDFRYCSSSCAVLAEKREDFLPMLGGFSGSSVRRCLRLLTSIIIGQEIDATSHVPLFLIWRRVSSPSLHIAANFMTTDTTLRIWTPLNTVAVLHSSMLPRTIFCNNSSPPLTSARSC